MFEHRVDDRQQLAHTGDEGHLWGLPRRTQPVIERANDDAGTGHAVLLHCEHLDALATPCHQGGQLLGLDIRQRRRRWSHHLRKVGQHLNQKNLPGVFSAWRFIFPTILGVRPLCLLLPIRMCSICVSVHILSRRRYAYQHRDRQ